MALLNRCVCILADEKGRIGTLMTYYEGASCVILIYHRIVELAKAWSTSVCPGTASPAASRQSSQASRRLCTGLLLVCRFRNDY